MTPFRLTSPPRDPRAHKTVKRLCPRCGAERTDEQYYRSKCFRGECGKRAAKNKEE